MHDIKFLITKHKLIHFMTTFKWFNMKVDVKLIKHQINLKSDIRVLRVQLNFKLKWVIYMHHIKAKLVIKQKIMQIIIKFTWNLLMMTRKQIYLQWCAFCLVTKLLYDIRHKEWKIIKRVWMSSWNQYKKEHYDRSLMFIM